MNDFEKKSALPNGEFLNKILKTRMPYGKYKGISLINLPERYVVWVSQTGYPRGELGEMMKIVYEIKLNGLEHLFKKFR